jgi:hypothetical protein
VNGPEACRRPGKGGSPTQPRRFSGFHRTNSPRRRPARWHRGRVVAS